MNTIITDQTGQVVRWYTGGLMHGGPLHVGETATEYNEKGKSTGSIFKYREYNPFTMSYVYAS